MQSQLNPYISFRDNAREAMTFYQTVFGGKLDLHTYAEFHAAQADGEEELIMHGTLSADNGIVIMGADTPRIMEFSPGARISLSLNGTDDTVLSAYFEKLSGDGGSVIMPLEKAQWGDKFGMLTDKFGVRWMVNVYAAKPAA